MKEVEGGIFLGVWMGAWSFSGDHFQARLGQFITNLKKSQAIAFVSLLHTGKKKSVPILGIDIRTVLAMLWLTRIYDSPSR